MAIRERPIKIGKQDDINVENLEKLFEYVVDMVKELNESITDLEATADDHETRIAALE